MPEWMLFVIVIGTPFAGLGIVAVTVMRRTANLRDRELLHYRYGENEIFLSKQFLRGVIVVVLCLWWLEWILPLPFLPLIFLAFFWFFLREQKAQGELSQSSSELLSELSSMAGQLEIANAKIQALANKVKITDKEIQRKSESRKAIESDIQDKLKEFDKLDTLTDEHKSILLNSIDEAVSKRSTSRIVFAIISAIALNLAATIIWTLLGSPGQEELLNSFRWSTGTDG